MELKSAEDRDLELSKAEEALSEKDVEIETRHRYLNTLKGIYWEAFEEGLMMPRTVLLLIESADRAIDHEENPI